MRSAIAWALWRCPRGARPRAFGRPRIVVAHHDMLPPGGWIARLVRAAAARADAVIVNSGAVARDLDPAGSLGTRLSVVYPGVDPAPPSRPASWPDGPPVVVVIGALVGWKRVDLALEAIALARREVPSLRLRVVGAPSGRRGRNAAAAGSPRVRAGPGRRGAVHRRRRRRPATNLRERRACCTALSASRSDWSLLRRSQRAARSSSPRPAGRRRSPTLTVVCCIRRVTSRPPRPESCRSSGSRRWRARSVRLAGGSPNGSGVNGC